MMTTIARHISGISSVSSAIPSAGVLPATLLGEHLDRERGRGDGDGPGTPCTHPGRRLLGWHGEMLLHGNASVSTG